MAPPCFVSVVVGESSFFTIFCCQQRLASAVGRIQMAPKAIGFGFVCALCFLIPAVVDAFAPSSVPTATRKHPTRTFIMSSSSRPASKNNEDDTATPHVSNVLFIECGFGNDSHGQSATKAAVRACRNAIEFNSIPSVGQLVPGGYDGLRLHVLLAVPPKYQSNLDLAEVQKVFPYGSVQFEVQDGGMVAPSGIAIDSLGDTNQDMVVVCAAVTVGY